MRIVDRLKCRIFQWNLTVRLHKITYYNLSNKAKLFRSFNEMTFLIIFEKHSFAILMSTSAKNMDTKYGKMKLTRIVHIGQFVVG